MEENMAYVIAEIGCNHKGDMDIAKKLVTVAATYCGARVVKFQKRNNKELLTEEQYNAPHPVPENSYGATYGLHREALEFTRDQHAELQAHCEKEGVIYSTSVWDLTSAKEIAALKPKLIKIPSACNLHFPMQEFLCKNYSGQVHLSVGMTTLKEMEEIVSFYEAHGRARDLVLYSCTSGYPVAFEDICLLEIQRLKEMFGKRVGQIGFSGHHLGIAVDVTALTLGAEWIERHFTLDRTWKGTDHAASLEPDGLRRLCRDIANVEKSLAFKRGEILPVEAVQREKLKWRANAG
jgi:N-acetylneuraminate synthase